MQKMRKHSSLMPENDFWCFILVLLFDSNHKTHHILHKILDINVHLGDRLVFIFNNDIHNMHMAQLRSQ